MTDSPQQLPTIDKHPKLMYIDCLRGYAILMVIICHVVRQYPELPYRAMQLAQTGWHGVQLFFLVSCVTLMISWRQDKAKGSVRIITFIIKRFFRIAPAYYLAALAYYFLRPPVSGADPLSLASTLLFVNGWTPDLMPTVEGHWNVVPGSWSISVEFTFYFLFPLFAGFVTSARRAFLIFLGSCLLGIVANELVGPRLAESYSELAVRNFLYFWFPNQCCVFALGGLAYFATRPAAGPLGGWRAKVALRPTSYLFMFLVIFAMLAYVPLPQSWSVAVLPPTLLCVSIVFLGFTSVLSQTKSSLFLNTAVAWIGKLSFSGYLIHWGVIEFLLHRNPHLFFTQATRYQAIGAYAFGLSMVVIVTFALAFIVYHLVEQPMIALGRLIVNKIKNRLVAKADLPDSLSGKDSLSANG